MGVGVKRRDLVQVCWNGRLRIILKVYKSNVMWVLCARAGEKDVDVMDWSGSKGGESALEDS
jgi:hypothetical protein